ncbi:MAG: type II toxin-antitoxin system HicB family antitoxin [Oscillospiraceae bacterium]|nr:type II toxin-antitoxin system HicB family antitoxin [Oscillospiraceae bacterium]
MAEYVYPAVFHPNADSTYTVMFPDLPGCITEGKSLENALYMSQSALTQWIEYLTETKQDVPAASASVEINLSKDEFINLTRADVRDSRAVHRTVSIPKWMDDQVAEAGLSLSRVLQDALKDRLSAHQ